MLPLVGIPERLATAMQPYRCLFHRQAGFQHVCRYLTGLLLCPNNTLQGIYADGVGPPGAQVSRRAMHEAVFAAGWDSEGLMPWHRWVLASDYRSRQRTVLSLDWTLSHHEWGEKIFGVKRAYNDVQRKMSRYQTVMTRVVANSQHFDGVMVEVQLPNFKKEERAYLEMTAQPEYTQMEQIQERLLELLHHQKLHHQKNNLEYRKRTEMAMEVVQQVESEGFFPDANDAFDHGVLNLELTRLIEASGKHWVSELECSRTIQWRGEWRRLDSIAQELRQEHPKGFRSLSDRTRQGETRQVWVLSKTVRLKRYGKKHLVVVHENEDLSDAARFWVTDALHWESKRVLETWSDRWTSEIFHEFGKPITGMESAQHREEEGVKRHVRLSCLAQLLLRHVMCQGQHQERFEFAQQQATIGQRVYSLGREALQQVVELIVQEWQQGQRIEQMVEVLRPS